MCFKIRESFQPIIGVHSRYFFYFWFRRLYSFFIIVYILGIFWIFQQSKEVFKNYKYIFDLLNFYNLDNNNIDNLSWNSNSLKKTAYNSVLAKCGVKYKIEKVKIFIRRCFSYCFFL